MSSNLDAVVKELKRQYNSPDFNNKKNPVDELIYILLSKRTNFEVNNLIYEKLKRTYNNWEQIMNTNMSELYDIIKSGGLGEEKAENIILLIEKLITNFGKLDIGDTFNKCDNAKIFNYLISLPGIGPKSAYCVMLYSLKRSVQPADAHVIRLFYRLGFIDYDQSRHHQAQKAISTICMNFPYQKNYDIHVNFKAHGEKVCKKRRPLCQGCVIYDYCAYS